MKVVPCRITISTLTGSGAEEYSYRYDAPQGWEKHVGVSVLYYEGWSKESAAHAKITVEVLVDGEWKKP